MKTEITEEVMFYDTDCGAVVSNIAYLRYVEKARSALFAKMGSSAAEMMKSQVFPAVIRTEIDYIFPLRLGDRFRVEAVLSKVEKVRLHCEFQIIIEGEPERVSVKAYQQLALVQMPSGRPKRAPREWVELTE